MDLIQALSDLGPEAADKLDILVNSTDEQLRQYVALWKQGQAAVEGATQQVAQTMPEVLNRIAEINQQAAEQVASLTAEIAALTQQIAALQQPMRLTAESILADLRAQQTAFTQWQTTMQQLVGRGLPGQLIGQLRELGPEALPYLEALVTMTDEQLFGPEGFVTLWKSGQAAITAASKTEMAEQIKLWKEHGAKIAAGIIAGVMSEQKELLAFFRNLFQNLLNEARRETKTRSPSQVYFQLGQQIIQGFQNGLDSMTPSLAAPSVGSGFLNGAGYRAGGGSPINMEINAVNNESLKSTLERAAFRMRNRRTGV